MNNCGICFNQIFKHSINELIICNDILTKRLNIHYNICNKTENLHLSKNINNNVIYKIKKFYKCEKCRKQIINKQNYDLHIKNKICQKIKTEFKCNCCGKCFQEKRSLIYHNIHSVCNKSSNKSNTQAEQEQISLHSQTINNTTNNINNGTNIQTQNNQNNQNIININIGSSQDTEKIIEMIPFRTTGYKITPKKYLEYVKYPERAIKSFIKDEHFNPKKPERMNVLNTNYKSNKVNVLDYDEDDEIRWLLKSKNDINELLCDRVINHLFMAKIMLENYGIKLDSKTEKKLKEQIQGYENDDKVKKKYFDMVS
jgi:hypothetical protein